MDSDQRTATDPEWEARNQERHRVAKTEQGRMQDMTAQNTWGVVGAGGSSVPLKERLLKSASEQQYQAHRLKELAERLTPEIEETISVLKEAIALGAVNLNSFGLERY